MLASHLVLLAAYKPAESVSLSSWDVWDLDGCVFVCVCTSRGVVGRDGQRVTEVNGKSAKPKSHTHPPHTTPPPSLPPSLPLSLSSIHPVTQPPPPSLCCGRVPAARPSVPAVVLDHVGQLDDELALFILLTALKGMFLEGVAEDRRDRETVFNSDDRWTENNGMFISLTDENRQKKTQVA